MDDLRLLLMREPRGHAAMSGRDPPAADARRRRLGRALHRGLGLPADVRARDDRRRHRAGRDGHGARCASRRRVVRLDTPGRTRRGARRGARAGAPRGHAAQRAELPRRARTWRWTCPASAPCATTWPTAATSTRSSPAAVGRARRRPGAGAGADRDGRWRSSPRSTRTRRRCTRRIRGSRGCAHVVFTAPGARRRRRARRDRDPPRLARPLAVRHRDVARGSRSCTPAASWRSATRSSRVGDRHALHRPVAAETRWPGGPAIVPGDHRPRVDHGMGQYLLDADDPFPAGFAL